jgi:hypothetical protein
VIWVTKIILTRKIVVLGLIIVINLRQLYNILTASKHLRRDA